MSLPKSGSSAFHSFFHSPRGISRRQFLLSSRAKNESFLPYFSACWVDDLRSTEKLNRPKARAFRERVNPFQTDRKMSPVGTTGSYPALPRALQFKPIPRLRIPDPITFQSSLRDFSMTPANPGLRPGLNSAVPTGLNFMTAGSQQTL